MTELVSAGIVNEPEIRSKKNYVEKYMLHLDPKVLGNQAVYMALATDVTFPGEGDSIIKCFEKLTVYGISGNRHLLVIYKQSDNFHFCLIP